MRNDFDVAIVGSGFGGSLLAMTARRIGLRVLLIERGRHPRFAIGESTSPLANILLEGFARRYDLPRIQPLCEYGSWKRSYPELVCGLKRGFTFYRHSEGQPYRSREDRANELLVAASPRDEVADTHWLRSDVDDFLVKEAIREGADYSHETCLTRCERHSSGWQLDGVKNGEPFRAKAALVVDASGPRGFLWRALQLGEEETPAALRSAALFSHFAGVERADRMPEYASTEPPPYPPDDAALHHVLDGGWMWVLRFENGIASAGVALDDSMAERLQLSEGAPAWQRFLASFPTIAEQFGGAEPVRRFDYMPRMAFHSRRAADEGWALLPSAAGFVDPLFSTGFPLTLLGLERLALGLERYGPGLPLEFLADYEQATLTELTRTERYIAACRSSFARFPRFVALSMLYFASASFTEMARRLDRSELVNGFLSPCCTEFVTAFSQATDEDCWHRDDLAKLIASGIEAIDIAGLALPGKRNWYAVDLEDLVRGAAKLGYSMERMRVILASAPWAA